MMLAALTLWKVVGWTAAFCALCALGLAIWLWIERETYLRNLKKMQRETELRRKSVDRFASSDGEDAYSPKKPRSFEK